jgi:lambda family phage portal protein
MREVLIPRQTGLERTGRFLDRLVTAVSPLRGLRRKQARAAGTMLGYKGALRDRLRANWTPMGGSADADLLADLPLLRERSRDLGRNDAHAAGITTTVVMHTIGSGIYPQSRVDYDAMHVTQESVLEFQKQAERNFQNWSGSADSQGRMDFYEMQALVERQILDNGEVLLIPLMLEREPQRPYSLALEVIEADRLETPTHLLSNSRIRDGVELGARGQPVAYYIRKAHPGDNVGAYQPGSWVRYPAFNEFGRPNVMHLYWVKRPGQTRGEPFFASVMTLFKDLSDYMEAELVSARVAACFSAFVTKNDPYNAAASAASRVDGGQRVQELEPGVIEYLAPGEAISFGSPSRPGGTFEPFVERILRAIGVGLGLPYELIAKDFSKTNYSSARSAILEAWMFFKMRQEWMIRRLCDPVWQMVQEEAWLDGDLPLVDLLGPDRPSWMRTRWIAPGKGWIDPVKEVQASQLAIEAGISTLADEAAANGKDWEEVLEQQKRELTKRLELGLPPPEAMQPFLPNAPGTDDTVKPAIGGSKKSVGDSGPAFAAPPLLPEPPDAAPPPPVPPAPVVLTVPPAEGDHLLHKVVIAQPAPPPVNLNLYTRRRRQKITRDERGRIEFITEVEDESGPDQ